MTINRYPDRIQFPDIASAAGFRNDDPKRLCGIVMQWVNEHGLSLYTRSTFRVVSVKTALEAIYDDVGEPESFLFVDGQVKYLDGNKKLTIEHGSYLSHLNMISVHSICQDGNCYYPTDEAGMLFEYPQISIDECYCRKDELQAFLAKMDEDAELPSSKTIAPKFGIQEQRILALKFWLAGKTGKPASEMQNGYDALEPPPTQGKLWDWLQEADKDLFSSGKDDFFKHHCPIKFKQGTSKGR